MESFYIHNKNQYLSLKKLIQTGGRIQDGTRLALEYGINDGQRYTVYTKDDEDNNPYEPPFFYRLLNDNEFIDIKTRTHALHIEAIDECHSIKDIRNTSHDEMVRYYTNISERMQVYKNDSKPIFYCWAHNLATWKNFVDFCEKNGLGNIINIIDTYPKCYRFDTDGIMVNQSYTHDKEFESRIRVYVNGVVYDMGDMVLEIGGHYGYVCVWHVARSAQYIITNHIPMDERHPNTRMTHTHYYDVKNIWINPDITQGYNTLRYDNSTKLIGINKYMVIPKYSSEVNKTVLQKYLENVDEISEYSDESTAESVEPVESEDIDQIENNVTEKSNVCKKHSIMKCGKCHAYGETSDIKEYIRKIDSEEEKNEYDKIKGRHMIGTKYNERYADDDYTDNYVYWYDIGFSENLTNVDKTIRIIHGRT